jgi:hypothetical protein
MFLGAWTAISEGILYDSDSDWMSSIFLKDNHHVVKLIQKIIHLCLFARKKNSSLDLIAIPEVVYQSLFFFGNLRPWQNVDQFIWRNVWKNKHIGIH